VLEANAIAKNKSVIGRELQFVVIAKPVKAIAKGDCASRWIHIGIRCLAQGARGET
jgi:hypothetical protein